MSFWKNIYLKDLEDIKNTHFDKLNVVMQQVADTLQSAYSRSEIVLSDIDVILTNLRNRQTVDDNIKRSRVTKTIAVSFTDKALTKLEVCLILLGLGNKTMLDQNKALELYFKEYEPAIIAEGLHLSDFIPQGYFEVKDENKTE